MSFNTNTGRAEYVASAGQTEFTYVFKTFNTSDIEVYLTPDGNTPDDVADLLVETTDYTVVQNGDNGGTVTLVSAAAINDTVIISRSLNIERQTDYQTGGDLNADTLDADQNYQTYLVQQNEQNLLRNIQFSNTTVGVDNKIPSPAAGYFKWKDDGSGIELDNTVADGVTAAAASAAAAAVSEANAAASEAAADADATATAADVVTVSGRLDTVQANAATVEANLSTVTSEPVATYLANAGTNATTASNAATAAAASEAAAEASAVAAAASALEAASYVSNPLPITLTGSNTGLELSQVVITDTDYDVNATYVDSVDFGSVVDNGDGTYTVTLPDYSVTTSVTFSLAGDSVGYTDNTKTHIISVTNTQVATPDFTGSASTGAEGTVVVLTDVNYEATATYTSSVDFGSRVDNGDGTYSVTLPAFGVATLNKVTFSIYGVRAGDIDSVTTNYVIDVTEVVFVADDAIVDDLTTDVINDGF